MTGSTSAVWGLKLNTYFKGHSLFHFARILLLGSYERGLFPSMSRMLIFLGILSALLVLSQWYLFLCVRHFILGRRNPITRRVAYPALVIIGLMNLVCVKVSMGTAMMHPDSFLQKFASVGYFSYLGFVLLCCLFLGLTELGVLLLHVKDAVTKRKRIWRSNPSEVVPAGGVHGCKSSPKDLEEGQLHSVPFPAGCKAESNQSPEKVTSARVSQPASVDGTGGVYSRRAFLKWGTVAGVTTAALLSGGGVARAYGKPLVERFDFVHPALANMRTPLTVIQITDFHFGMFFGRRELEILVNNVNALDADAVCITGDIFHASMLPVAEAAPILERLRPRKHGNLAILGNHDFYAGAHRAADTLRKAGIRVLRDEWITLKHGETEIHLGGIDDPVADWVWGKDFPNFGPFMRDAPRGKGLRILLSHRPSILDTASDAGIDLILAGHIHGGQIILPVPGAHQGVSLAAIAVPYTHGWYRRGNAQMYLNRGIGVTFVPWRINCPPEIAVFRLLPPRT
jgi:predicted MPP superfamily phosphohydrolase